MWCQRTPREWDLGDLLASGKGESGGGGEGREDCISGARPATGRGRGEGWDPGEAGHREGAGRRRGSALGSREREGEAAVCLL